MGSKGNGEATSERCIALEKYGLLPLRDEKVSSANDLGADHSLVLSATDIAGTDGRAHVVQFYESESFLVEELTRFVGAGLGAGEATLVIATKAHMEALEQELAELGIDLAIARTQGRYVALDADETLAKFMVGGLPDEARFRDVIGGMIAEAERRHGRVRAFGEMVYLLWRDGRAEGTRSLEDLWNELACTQPFSLLCAYPVTAFGAAADSAPFRKICGQHSHVVPAEGYSDLARSDERLRRIAELQQKARALDRESAERRVAEERSRWREEDFSNFVEYAPLPIHFVAPDGIILKANRAELDLLGYAAEEYVGHHIAEFYVDRPVIDDILRRLASGETLSAVEARVRCKDGSIKQVLIHSNVHWETGRFVHTRCFTFDITEQRRLERQREDLLRAKDHFLATLSHELRSPLSAVQHAVATARLDESRRLHALEIAARQAEQLGRLVDDLLDVTRIAQGRIVLRKEPVRLADVIPDAVETTRSFIESGGISLAVAIPAETILVEADRTRLEQILVNVLSNAAKYTDAGGRIEVIVERQGDEVAIRVLDTGIGIAPEMLSRIWDLFAQADEALERGQGGLGIGLTVARRLVELHGARIDAHSDGPGKGTEFVVTFPVFAAEADEDGVVEREVTPQRPCDLLVVDDHPDTAESLAMFLELNGHRVRAVYNGVAALDAARAYLPDVMLIDIGLPGMDGYEVARGVRRDPNLKRVALIALTGYGREEDKRRALEAGFDHHIVKPLDPAALHQLLSEVGRRGELDRDAQSSDA